MEVESAAVLLGGGRSGVNWAEQSMQHMIVMDTSTSLQSDIVRITVADALAIPLPDRSVRFMRADFLLNVAFLSRITHLDIIGNPDVLKSPEIPLLIRGWYEELRKPFDIYRGDLMQVTWLARQIALEEMMRVLMPKGLMIILDHRPVIKWALGEVASCDDVLGYRVALSEDDYSRSRSLRKLKRNDPKTAIEKIYVTKL